MRSLNLKLFFFSFFLLGCATLKTTKPLEKADFKEHNWKIVYIEDQTDLKGDKYSQNIWLLDDNRVIDSLRNEYCYDSTKLGDGDKEYQIYLFKDNLSFDWVCFNNKKSFRLGKIKAKLIPVNTQYYYFSNLHDTKMFTDSLNKLGVVYTISPIVNEDKKINDFAIKIDLNINTKSKIFQNKDSGLNDWIVASKKELTRLYPELNIIYISFIGSNTEWSPGAPGDMVGGNENFSYQRFELKIVLSLNKPFIFDIQRLNNTDLFSSYQICSLYTIATYKEK